MEKTFSWLGALACMIGMIALSVLMAINFTYLYHWVIDRYRLIDITGLSRESLIENYWHMITYLQLPWIRELHLPDFSISDTGRLHFEEVKAVFLGLYVVAIILIIVWLALVIRGIRILPIFNRAANLTMSLFSVLGFLMLLDFGRIFTWFHILIFNNDFWILYPHLDPVILALPYQLFLIKAFFVITMLFVFSLSIKFLYIRYYSPTESDV